jgi:hypothetical protein
MKVIVSLAKDGKELAGELAEVVRHGDLSAAIGRVFGQARLNHPGYAGTAISPFASTKIQTDSP